MATNAITRIGEVTDPASPLRHPLVHAAAIAAVMPAVVSPQNPPVPPARPTPAVQAVAAVTATPTRMDDAATRSAVASAAVAASGLALREAADRQRALARDGMSRARQSASTGDAGRMARVVDVLA